ncbi:hypothetical protein RFI_02036 [Reticulomyxa filosa]|uniref:Uncharacterized protein n=1 Tax=Reticulomyxa filosa TaxID=46433 RepID=X6PA79_RETFI|nr:hypothetical protein RFI_02036 [Reticulomyxa filosa]|eukprot:ETO35038.1 hypothetical protein RFI_02036 [Reticulomyxa filosa]
MQVQKKKTMCTDTTTNKALMNSEANSVISQMYTRYKNPPTKTLQTHRHLGTGACVGYTLQLIGRYILNWKAVSPSLFYSSSILSLLFLIHLFCFVHPSSCDGLESDYFAMGVTHGSDYLVSKDEAKAHHYKNKMKLEYLKRSMGNAIVLNLLAQSYVIFPSIEYCATHKCIALLLSDVCVAIELVQMCYFAQYFQPHQYQLAFNFVLTFLPGKTSRHARTYVYIHFFVALRNIANTPENIYINYYYLNVFGTLLIYLQSFWFSAVVFRYDKSGHTQSIHTNFGLAFIVLSYFAMSMLELTSERILALIFGLPV